MALSASFRKYSDVFQEGFYGSGVLPCTVVEVVVGMPRRSPYEITLSAQEQFELEAIARKYTSSYRDVVRAKIILMAAQGLTNEVIGSRLDMPRQIVSKWRKRFYESGFPGLEEQPRGGAPARFSPQRRRRS